MAFFREDQLFYLLSIIHIGTFTPRRNATLRWTRQINPTSNTFNVNAYYGKISPPSLNYLWAKHLAKVTQQNFIKIFGDVTPFYVWMELQMTKNNLGFYSIQPKFNQLLTIHQFVFIFIFYEVPKWRY